MMKTLIMFLVIASLSILPSCAEKASTGDIPHEESISDFVSTPLESQGGDVMNLTTDERYRTISIELINYVGTDVFEAWCDDVGDFNIQLFVQHFQIPKNVFTDLVRIDYTPEAQAAFCEFYQENLTLSELQDRLGYSLEEIDALYASNQYEINRLFCGPLGVFNERDGQIYSLDWLAEHSAADYIEAGLPLDRVEEILTLAEDEASPVVQELAADVQETLINAMALEEERLSAEPSAE